MKRLEEYIEENKRLLYRRKEQLKNNSFSSEETKILRHNIDTLENYIKGLEDSKKLIKESD